MYSARCSSENKNKQTLLSLRCICFIFWKKKLLLFPQWNFMDAWWFEPFIFLIICSNQYALKASHVTFLVCCSKSWKIPSISIYLNEGNTEAEAVRMAWSWLLLPELVLIVLFLRSGNVPFLGISLTCGSFLHKWLPSLFYQHNNPMRKVDVETQSEA